MDRAERWLRLPARIARVLDRVSLVLLVLAMVALLLLAAT